MTVVSMREYVALHAKETPKAVTPAEAIEEARHEMDEDGPSFS